MSHAPVEIVEEDAADLQFPKGKAFADIFHFDNIVHVRTLKAHLT